MQQVGKQHDESRRHRDARADRTRRRQIGHLLFSCSFSLLLLVRVKSSKGAADRKEDPLPACAALIRGTSESIIRRVTNKRDASRDSSRDLLHLTKLQTGALAPASSLPRFGLDEYPKGPASEAARVNFHA